MPRWIDLKCRTLTCSGALPRRRPDLDAHLETQSPTRQTVYCASRYHSQSQHQSAKSVGRSECPERNVRLAGSACSRSGTCGDLALQTLIRRRSTIPATETALEILPRWEDALTGIEEYSHLFVIVWLDRVRRARKPRLHVPEGREGLPEVGLFATRTPRRPNPLGVSAPRLLRREGNVLWVTGIDAWPDTPILDIKGYAPRDDLRQDATVPDWLETLWTAHDAERG